MRATKQQDIMWRLAEWWHSLSEWYLFFIWVVAVALTLFYLAMHGIW